MLAAGLKLEVVIMCPGWGSCFQEKIFKVASYLKDTGHAVIRQINTISNPVQVSDSQRKPNG